MVSNSSLLGYDAGLIGKQHIDLNMGAVLLE
jgi:hypothetical protein